MDPIAGETASKMGATQTLAGWAAEAGRLMLASPDATTSIGAMLLALLVSIAWVKSRFVRGPVLARVFPRRWRADPSHRLDAVMFLINWKLLALVAAGMILSFYHISQFAHAGMVSLLGPAPEPVLPVWAVLTISTVVLFVAYEFAYWLDHALCHRVPFFWEFHRVHHEATVLSPLTVYRVHPVDTLLFANITALVTGLTHGVVTWALGQPADELLLFGVNVILLGASWLLIQLQHSHIWIPATGWLGRILMSPAHHHIHHSVDPKHFGSNMGGCLAIFDWMFGTLIVPERQRQRLRFGVEDANAPAPHTLQHGLLAPFWRAGTGLLAAIRRPSAAARPAPDLARSG